MKIEIKHRPVFMLELPLSTIELLQRLARLHYDARCKAAADAGPRGFLHGWHNMVEFGDKAVGPAEPNELDTVAKILEFVPDALVAPGERQVIMDIRESITRAMREAKVWL